MIDLNLFATQVTSDKASGKPGFGQFQNGELGLTQRGNVNFLNALLGNIKIADGEIKTTDVANNSSDTTTSLKSDEADLALLQLALLGQDPDKSLEEKLSELKIEKLANTKENRITQLTKLIDHLTSGLPEQAIGNGNIEQLANRLEKRLGQLEASLESLRAGDFETDDSALKALIATGLNPAQLTKITDRIQEVEDKLGRELTVEDLIAGVGNIIPVPNSGKTEDGEFEITDALSILINQSQKNNEEKQLQLEKSIQDKKLRDSQKDDNGGVDGLALAQSNADNIIAANVANTGQNKSNSAQNLLNAINPKQTSEFSNSAASGNFLNNGQNANSGETSLPLTAEEISQRLSNGEYQEIFGSTKKGLAAQSKMNVADVAASLSNTQTGQKVESLLNFSFSDVLASTDPLSQALGFDIQTGAPFTTSMQAASFASNNIIAGQTHPATQAVAAQISKSAQSGETRQMTLQLDPPELGRVEIRLEFGDERMVKANIVVEKPETLLMLQRDAQALERALQNAGLDTDSGSLDFQMADDGHAFNSDREGDSRHGGTGGGTEGSNDNEEIEFIDTQMTWDVDPETGHVHYNILA